MEAEVGESANSNASKRRPEEEDGRNLDTSAEVSMEGESLHDGKDAFLRKPSAHPVEGRRKKTGEENHPTKIGKQAEKGLKTGRIRIHAEVSMR